MLSSNKWLLVALDFQMIYSKIRDFFFLTSLQYLPQTFVRCWGSAVFHWGFSGWHTTTPLQWAYHPCGSGIRNLLPAWPPWGHHAIHPGPCCLLPSGGSDCSLPTYCPQHVLGCLSTCNIWHWKPNTSIHSMLLQPQHKCNPWIRLA